MPATAQKHGVVQERDRTIGSLAAPALIWP